MLYLKKKYLGFLLNRIHAMSLQKPMCGLKLKLYRFLCDQYMSGYTSFVQKYGNLD